MPIYAYRCESCGFEKDALQKISDAPLSQCPSCGADTFRKQVTAAGFQLKGSGWYVTDFRGGNNGGGKRASATEAKAQGEAATSSESSKPAGEGAAAPAASSGTASASTTTSGTASSTTGTT
jgi:putative FmdB family regulatory protein